ncbi:MAG: hypothetical protein K0R27_2497 [Xanthobacteraceae bacterium]|jgi:hypothetical protein|nr:hypothetical protein [Xanthobacteraceae bacterium]
MGIVLDDLSQYFALMRMYHLRPDPARRDFLKGTISLQAMNEPHPAIRMRYARLVERETKRLEAG